MVAQVKGSVDGQDIIFSRTEGGRWEATVPLDLDGTYVIDLTAIDDAGNESYYATVLFAVDPETLHITMEVLKYRLQPVDRGYSLYAAPKLGGLEPLSVGYSLEHQPSGYHLERGHICELQQ